MKLSVKTQDITNVKCDVLIVNLFDGVKTPGGATGVVDKALGGAIAKVIKNKEFTGKKGTTAVVDGTGKIGAGRVVIVGLGKQEEFDLDCVRLATAKSLCKARAMKAKSVVTIMHGAGTGGLYPADTAAAIAEGALLGLYKFDKYVSKKKDDEAEKINELYICEIDKGKTAAIRKGLKLGQELAESANMARDLINEPPNVLNAAGLARHARKLGKRKNLSVRIYNKKEIRAMKMEAFLGVNKGSRNDPFFITIEYKGAPKVKKTMGIVGKGITFDSGGLSLKPSSAMDTMKSDMSGAAAVLGTMDAISRIAPKVNVTGVIATTDNMPGGGAQCIGDIVRASNGKTIEIKNTDAEGRLILADALAWSAKKELNPIIDLATLTGACVVALGTYRTGLFSNDDKLVEKIKNAGAKTGEKYWRLPIDPEYFDAVKTDIADMKNVGDRNAGATTAALFLKEFIGKDTQWAHLDIAGTAFLEKPQGYYIKGGTGVGVRTLATLAMDMF